MKKFLFFILELTILILGSFLSIYLMDYTQTQLSNYLSQNVLVMIVLAITINFVVFTILPSIILYFIYRKFNKKELGDEEYEHEHEVIKDFRKVEIEEKGLDKEDIDNKHKIKSIKSVKTKSV